MPSVNPIGQFVLVLSLVLLSFIILGDPVEKFSMDYEDWLIKNATHPDQNKYYIHVQSLIPTRVHLSHFSRIFQTPQTSEGLCQLIHDETPMAPKEGKHACRRTDTDSKNKKNWFKT